MQGSGGCRARRPQPIVRRRPLRTLPSIGCASVLLPLAARRGHAYGTPFAVHVSHARGAHASSSFPRGGVRRSVPARRAESERSSGNRDVQGRNELEGRSRCVLSSRRRSIRDRDQHVAFPQGGLARGDSRTGRDSRRASGEAGGYGGIHEAGRHRVIGEARADGAHIGKQRSDRRDRQVQGWPLLAQQESQGRVLPPRRRGAMDEELTSGRRMVRVRGA